jgi:hypothetical protein
LTLLNIQSIKLHKSVVVAPYTKALLDQQRVVARFSQANKLLVMAGAVHLQLRPLNTLT